MVGRFVEDWVNFSPKSGAAHSARGRELWLTRWSRYEPRYPSSTLAACCAGEIPGVGTTGFLGGSNARSWENNLCSVGGSLGDHRTAVPSDCGGADCPFEDTVGAGC